MRVYFTASLRGKKDYIKSYELISRYVVELGERLVSDHVLKNSFEDVASQDKEQAKESYFKLISWIKTTDVFLAEVSTQSLSVGHEITEAMNLGKPVVLLYMGDRRPSMLFGSNYDKLQLIQYEIGDLKKILMNAFAEAKKNMDVRFNFFVSPKILNYLDFVAKNRMVPRAVFLRDLIEREMRKDKEFNNEN
jgi:hypothetical protein